MRASTKGYTIGSRIVFRNGTAEVVAPPATASYHPALLGTKPLDAVSNGRGKVSLRRTPLDATGTTGGKASVLDKVAMLRPARPVVPQGAFSVKDYMQRFELSHGAALYELKGLVERGVIATAMGSRGGHVGSAERMYWPA